MLPSAASHTGLSVGSTIPMWSFSTRARPRVLYARFEIVDAFHVGHTRPASSIRKRSELAHGFSLEGKGGNRLVYRAQVGERISAGVVVVFVVP